MSKTRRSREDGVPRRRARPRWQKNAAWDDEFGDFGDGGSFGERRRPRHRHRPKG